MAFKDILTKTLRLGRRPKAPRRDTLPFPLWLWPNSRGSKRPVYKPTPRNLRAFSETPYARRAINAIKNPIARLEWEIVPVPGVEMNSELERQIAVVKASLANPNNDDSFRSMTEQVVEDMLCGAGAIEMQPGADRIWLFPTDGLAIQVHVGWSGDPNEARYCQTSGYGAYNGVGVSGIDLRNDELVYIRPNPRTSTPFGLGPLEVAFTTIARQLGLDEFAANVVTNAKPSSILDMGEGATPEQIAAFRSYWINEIEGQGTQPIISGKGAKVHRLFPEGDDALHPLFQEYLIRTIAASFDLSPQNLNIERDVKVGNGETAESRDWDQAIVPWATLYASSISREIIQGRLGFSQLCFRFPAIDAEEEGPLSENYARDYENNAVTPNEYRKRKGMAPLPGQFGDLTKIEADALIAQTKAEQAVKDQPQKGAPAKPVAKTKD